LYLGHRLWLITEQKMIAFAQVARRATCDEILNIVSAALGYGLYVVYVKHNIWSTTAAILAREVVSFKYLESGFLSYFSHCPSEGYPSAAKARPRWAASRL